MEQVLFIITLPYPFTIHIPSPTPLINLSPNKTWVPLPKNPLAQFRSLVWLPNCVECRSGQGQCLGAVQVPLNDYHWCFRNPGVHHLRLVVYPINCRVLYIPDHPRWLFGISEPSTVPSQYQYDQSNWSVQYIHFHYPEPSWYHWGGMRSCSSHIITSFLHFKLFW